MSTEQSHEELLQGVLDLIIDNNRQMKPGSPLAELKAAIETALAALPPLEFEEFGQAIEDKDAATRLVHRAPELIGWNADQIIEWIEELARKL